MGTRLKIGPWEITYGLASQQGASRLTRLFLERLGIEDEFMGGKISNP